MFIVYLRTLWYKLSEGLEIFLIFVHFYLKLLNAEVLNICLEWINEWMSE